MDRPQEGLWPGASVQVRHILAQHDKALVLPEGCLVHTLEGYQAFVVGEGKIIRRKLTLGARRAGRVHILSGVSLDESVVIAQTERIKEGMAAKAVDWAGEW